MQITQITKIHPLASACISAVAEAMRMSTEEHARFTAGAVPRLLASLPFLAGCDEAERTAVAHLGVYVLALRGDSRLIFDHAPGDDTAIGARLRLVSSFKGGDAAVIDAGMARLELVMLHGYQRDVGKDSASGEYNPIHAGVWDYDALVEASTQRARFGEFPELDAILPEMAALMTWWGS